MRKTRHILPVLAAVIAPAGAATLTLDSIAGVYIRASESNQGSNQTTLVGDTSNPNDFLRGVFAFDLTDPLLTGATINSVTLTLTIASVDGSSTNTANTIDLRELDSSFTQFGVTWTSRNGTDSWITAGGDFGPTLASVSANASAVTLNQKFDFTSAGLTSAGAGAVGGNLHLIAALATEDANRSIFRFASDVHDTVSRRPVLTIDYTPVPEPGVVPLSALAALSLARRRR